MEEHNVDSLDTGEVLRVTDTPPDDLESGPVTVPGSSTPKQKFVLLNATPSPQVEIQFSKCSVCDKLFISKSTLQAHKQRRHPESVAKSKRKRAKAEQKRTILMKRDNVIVDRTEVEGPREKFIKMENIDDVAGDSVGCVVTKLSAGLDHENYVTNRHNYVCKTCGLNFANFGYFCSHLKVHEKEKTLHRCNICKMMLATELELLMHYRTHIIASSPPSYLSCNFCLRTFDTRHDVETHQQLEHSFGTCISSTGLLGSCHSSTGLAGSNTQGPPPGSVDGIFRSLNVVRPTKTWIPSRENEDHVPKTSGVHVSSAPTTLQNAVPTIQLPPSSSFGNNYIRFPDNPATRFGHDTSTRHVRPILPAPMTYQPMSTCGSLSLSPRNMHGLTTLNRSPLQHYLAAQNIRAPVNHQGATGFSAGQLGNIRVRVSPSQPKSKLATFYVTSSEGSRAQSLPGSGSTLPGLMRSPEKTHPVQRSQGDNLDGHDKENCSKTLKALLTNRRPVEMDRELKVITLNPGRENSPPLCNTKESEAVLNPRSSFMDLNDGYAEKDSASSASSSSTISPGKEIFVIQPIASPRIDRHSHHSPRTEMLPLKRNLGPSLAATEAMPDNHGNHVNVIWKPMKSMVVDESSSQRNRETSALLSKPLFEQPCASGSSDEKTPRKKPAYLANPKTPSDGDRQASLNNSDPVGDDSQFWRFWEKK